MFQAAFEALAIDVRHELLDVPPAGLPAAIESLRDETFLGAHVTVPHKERTAPLMDRLTDEAHVTGAVNTITKEGSRLIGHNTDVPGFRKALDVLVGRQKMPRAAVVLGAGGGARAVVYGLITEGFQRVVVFNRHLHRAEGLVRHFARSAAHMELRAMPWHESVIEAELARTKVLVNATSVGLDSDASPLPGELLPPELLVMDLVYRPRETRLLRDARAAGAAGTLNGEPMLLHQGAAQFELWTGQPAPLDLMRERLDAAEREAEAQAATPTGAAGGPVAGA
jgi:shikimate dehydrogenase